MGSKNMDVSRVTNGALDLRYTERIPQDAQVVLVADDSEDGDGHVHVVFGTPEALADAGYAGRGSTERKLHKIVKDADEEPVTAPRKKSTAKRK